MDFSRYLRYLDPSGSVLRFGEDWGVYQYPDGQNQIWFAPSVQIDRQVVSMNHSAVNELIWQTARAIGRVNTYVTYLYGARSDKILSGDRRIANVAQGMRDLLAVATSGKELIILVPHDSQANSVPFDGLVDLSQYDGIVFPDSSAKSRQPWLQSSGIPSITFEKVRNQETGDITGLALSDDIPGKRLLVADDICDGGTTFIKVAELLPGRRLDLSVVHGIFSGGALDRLTAAGYENIFTTNSYVPHDMFQEQKISERCTVSDVWGLGS